MKNATQEPGQGSQTHDEPTTQQEFNRAMLEELRLMREAIARLDQRITAEEGHRGITAKDVQ